MNMKSLMPARVWGFSFVERKSVYLLLAWHYLNAEKQVK